MNKKLIAVAVIAFSVVIAGCAKSGAQVSASDLDLERQLELRSQEVEMLQSSKMSLTQELQSTQTEVKAKEDALKQAHLDVEQSREAKLSAERAAAAAVGMQSGTELFPPNAKVNECYARVFVPPTYSTASERVLKQEQSDRIEISPARFDWATEQVLVKEASMRVEVVPAEYGWKEEQVLIKPASTELVEVPAEYKWVTEKLLVKPAHTTWKKGHGPIEKVDNGTGEIMCLVEVPAVYETVKKKVLVNAAHTKEIAIPAEYETVKSKVVVRASTTREIEIPAEYDTVKVRRLVTPAQEQRISIPAEYGNVTKTSQVTEGHMEWLPVMCETNMTAVTVQAIQKALRNKGHNPGPIDGVYGPLTHNAVRLFQQENRLPTGGLTLKTVQALGV